MPIPGMSTHGPFAPPAAVYVPPPPYFRRIMGEIESPEIDLQGRVCDVSKGRTIAQEGGLRYERKVQAHLRSRLGVGYAASPVLRFADASGRRAAIPDGVLLRGLGSDGPELAIIIEIKVQHVPEAWWQLEQLYRPVIQKLWPRTTIRTCEVVRTFDPSTPFPCDFEVIEWGWFEKPGRKFAVMRTEL